MREVFVDEKLRVAGIDFDKTLLCPKLGDNSKWQFNEPLIKTLIQAQKDGFKIIGFTNFMMDNYDDNHYRSSPGRRAVVDILENRYGFEFDAVIVSSTYLATIELILKQKADDQTFDEYVEESDIDERIALLDIFFQEKIYGPEIGYEEDKESKHQQLHDDLRGEEERLETVVLDKAVENGLPGEAKSTNKSGMFALAKMFFSDNFIVFDDNPAVISKAEELGVGNCPVLITGTSDDGFVCKTLQKVDYSHYLTQPVLAKEIERIMAGIDLLSPDNVPVQAFVDVFLIGSRLISTHLYDFKNTIELLHQKKAMAIVENDQYHLNLLSTLQTRLVSLIDDAFQTRQASLDGDYSYLETEELATFSSLKQQLSMSDRHIILLAELRNHAQQLHDADLQNATEEETSFLFSFVSTELIDLRQEHRRNTIQKVENVILKIEKAIFGTTVELSQDDDEILGGELWDIVKCWEEEHGETIQSIVNMAVLTTDNLTPLKGKTLDAFKFNHLKRIIAVLHEEKARAIIRDDQALLSDINKFQTELTILFDEELSSEEDTLHYRGKKAKAAFLYLKKQVDMPDRHIVLLAELRNRAQCFRATHLHITREEESSIFPGSLFGASGPSKQGTLDTLTKVENVIVKVEKTCLGNPVELSQIDLETLVDVLGDTVRNWEEKYGEGETLANVSYR